MARHNQSGLADFTRGGQLFLHSIRMFGQVVIKFGKWLLLLSLMSLVCTWCQITPPHDRYLSGRMLVACALAGTHAGDSPTTVRTAGGRTLAMTNRQLCHSAPIRAAADRALTNLAWGILAAALLAMLGLTLVIWGLWRTGKRQRDDEHARGTQVVDGPELNRMIRKRRLKGPFQLAGIDMIRDFETRHTLLTGTTGTGKTTLLRDWMRQIRRRGDRVICYSPSGDFIEWFYREDTDHILNPFDARCGTWDLWAECTQPYHYDMIAAAVVPEPTKGDPFWNMAARIVIATLLRVLKERDNATMPAFLHHLAGLELRQLHQLLRGTEAAALLDPESEKTATSIRTTAATYARAFQYLPAQGPAFHIREWVLDERTSSWLFLNARPDQIEAVRPVLTAQIELATNTIMSLPADPDRRIWLILDETPSLNSIPSLPRFLAEARKYGGCAVLSFQQISQLHQRYGKEGGNALAGLCSTWACFAQNDPETAEWVSRAFGEQDLIKQREGVSYGANEIRDGVSLQQDERLRKVVLPSEITTLPALTGLIRQPGDLPIARFRLVRTEPVTMAKAFIAGATSQSPRLNLFDTASIFATDDQAETGDTRHQAAEARPMPALGLDPDKTALLARLGYDSLDRFSAATAEELLAVDGISERDIMLIEHALSQQGVELRWERKLPASVSAQAGLF